LARAVAGAATNMFRLATKQSHTGFCAARHVLNCFGGPAWKDQTNINLNPGADAMAYLTGSDNAREIIAGKLAEMAGVRERMRSIRPTRVKQTRACRHNAVGSSVD
jgi:hypothetical protein